jgi:hypothetical protein
MVKTLKKQDYMKTKFLLLLFTVISGNVFSQSVFPESDAIWNIQIDGEEHYYGLSGDTTFNDTVYSKLYLLNDTTLNIDPNDVYIGGFRQEDKKVWFRPVCIVHEDGEISDDEVLLYDFSKNAGDTIWNVGYILGQAIDVDYFCIRKSRASRISIIEDTFIDNNKKGYSSSLFYYFNGGATYLYQEDTVIEGIGSIKKGLFWFLYYPSMSSTTSIKLACFKHGNEVKYLNNPKCNTCFCWLSTGISELDVTPVDVLYENKTVRIQGVSSIFPCQLDLFTSEGEVLFTKNTISGEYPIPVTENLSGIYLYQLRKNNEIIKSGKIIIK